jgi:hypothetical protein
VVISVGSAGGITVMQADATGDQPIDQVNCQEVLGKDSALSNRDGAVRHAGQLYRRLCGRFTHPRQLGGLIDEIAKAGN